MKRPLTLFLALFALTTLFSSCKEHSAMWGIYRTAEENGNYESIEFAYSKCIYIEDQSAVNNTDKNKNDNGYDEGWYTKEDDKVTCTFTSDEDGGVTVITVMTFTCGDDDTLNLTNIKSTKKSADGKKTEESAEYNKLFSRGSED